MSTPEPSNSDSTEQAPSTSEEPSSSLGWFSSFVQSAKESVSKTTLESIKRDLSEFKDIVHNDTKNICYSTASLVKSTLTEIGNTVNEIGSLGSDELEGGEQPIITETKEEETTEEKSTDVTTEGEDGLVFNLDAFNSWTDIIADRAKSTIDMVKGTLVDSIFTTRSFSPEELYDEPCVIKDNQIIQIPNWKEMLHQLQIDADTYCREPAGPPEDFDSWLTKFNLMNYQKQMEHLLENIPEIKKFHDDLVPRTLSESDFWHRYYFKVHQLREEQKRKILNSDSETVNEEDGHEYSTDVTYLHEQAGSHEGSKSISPSTTDEWEKMDGSSGVVGVPDSKNSSDDDRDWVKCD